MHDCLINLAMDLATLCDMWRRNGTKGHHLAVFIIDTVLACHFVAPTTPTLHPIGVLVVLAMPLKNYLKWQAIQLAIHSTVGV